mgnify:CR=1 FL=1
MSRLIDLSVLVENSPSEPMQITVKRLAHREGARHFCREAAWNKRFPLPARLRQLWAYLQGQTRIVPADFPNEEFLSLDTVTLTSHMGTHLDAPIHYGSRCEGKPARSVDQLPVDWFYHPGVCLDLRCKKPQELITQEDIEQALTKAGHCLQPLDIVLICTGTDKRWGTPQYFSHAPGMSRAATEWLLDRGVKVIGIDTYGFDRPFPAMLADFWRTKDQSHLWPAHFLGREREYIQIERLVNLDQLPLTGFQVACFPLRIKGLDASWIRAVAIIDE